MALLSSLPFVCYHKTISLRPGIIVYILATTYSRGRRRCRYQVFLFLVLHMRLSYRLQDTWDLWPSRRLIFVFLYF